MATTTNMYSHKSKAYSNRWRAKQFAVDVIHVAKNVQDMDFIHRFVPSVLVISAANNVKMNAQ